MNPHINTSFSRGVPHYGLSADYKCIKISLQKFYLELTEWVGWGLGVGVGGVRGGSSGRMID